MSFGVHCHSKNHFCVGVHIRIRPYGGWPSHGCAYYVHLRLRTQEGRLSDWYYVHLIRITHPLSRIYAHLWSHIGVCGEICAFMHVYTPTPMLALHTHIPTPNACTHITHTSHEAVLLIRSHCRSTWCSMFVHSTDGLSDTRLLSLSHYARGKLLTIFRQSVRT